MFIVWQFIIPILLILAVIRWLAKSKEQKAMLDDSAPRRRNTQRFKCAFCLYCKRMDEDGVLCKAGKTPTFKTPVHINNCMDFTRDS